MASDGCACGVLCLLFIVCCLFALRLSTVTSCSCQRAWHWQALHRHLPRPAHTPSLGSDRGWLRGQVTHLGSDVRPLDQQQHPPRALAGNTNACRAETGGLGSAVLTGCPGVPVSPVFENQRCEEGQVGSEWGRVALSRANCLRFPGSATVCVLSHEGACVSSWSSAVVQCERIVTES